MAHAGSGRRNVPPSPKGMNEVLEFLQQLWSLDRTLQKISRSMLVRLGVTGPERLVIRVVGLHPGISAGAVAEILRVHPSTLTGVFKKLARRRYILRETDESDGRRALLRLTEEGRRLAAVRANTLEEAVRAALSRMPARKVATTKEALEVLTKLLKESI